MKCKNCGDINEEGSLFCQECGEPLVDSAKTKKHKTDNKKPDSEKTKSKKGARVTVRRGRRARETESDRIYRSRLPYLITAFLAAAVSVVQFVLPFFNWVSYSYMLLGNNVSNDKLDLIDLANRFYKNDNLVTFVTGSEDVYGIKKLIPGEAHEKFSQGRTAAIYVSYIFIISLVLYLAFIILVLLRKRIGAAALGIIASLVNALGCMGVMYAVKLLVEAEAEYNSFSWISIELKALEMPYAGLAVSGIIIMLCVVFVILGINTGKKPKKKKHK